MAMQGWRLVTVTLAVCVGLLVGAGLQDPVHADDTPACATQSEWQNIDVNMYPWRVADIIGNDGWFINSDNGVIRRGYNLCNGWQPDGDWGKVKYDEQSRFSFDWYVVHVG